MQATGSIRRTVSACEDALSSAIASAVLQSQHRGRAHGVPGAADRGQLPDFTLRPCGAVRPSCSRSMLALLPPLHKSAVTVCHMTFVVGTVDVIRDGAARVVVHADRAREPLMRMLWTSCTSHPATTCTPLLSSLRPRPLPAPLVILIVLVD